MGLSLLSFFGEPLHTMNYTLENSRFAANKLEASPAIFKTGRPLIPEPCPDFKLVALPLPEVIFGKTKT
jgi:hypothetical protein